MLGSQNSSRSLVMLDLQRNTHASQEVGSGMQAGRRQGILPAHAGPARSHRIPTALLLLLHGASGCHPHPDPPPLGPQGSGKELP